MSTEKDDLIYNFLQGDLTTTEEIELMEWLDSSDKHRQFLTKIQNVWNVMASDGTIEYDTNLALQKFHQQIAAETTNNNYQSKRQHNIWLRMTQIAASVLLLASVAWGAYHIGHNTENQELSEIVMSTPNGSYANCTLPDGTRLNLFPGSVITYPHDFGQKERRIHLKGEAVFDVKHDDEVPFVVNTGHVEVKDLGTTFRCKDFTDENRVEVQLIQGLVSVNNLGSSKLYDLKACQQLSLNKKTKTITISNYAEGEENRSLSFDGDDLEYIAKILERIYGVNISFRGDILSKSYSFHGKFDPMEQGITDILDVMSHTNLIHYSERGKSIIVW